MCDLPANAFHCPPIPFNAIAQAADSHAALARVFGEKTKK